MKKVRNDVVVVIYFGIFFTARYSQKLEPEGIYFQQYPGFPPDIYMEAARDTLKFDFNLLFQLCFIFISPFLWLSHTDNNFGASLLFSLFSSIDMDTVMEGITKENKEKSRDFFFPLL